MTDNERRWVTGCLTNMTFIKRSVVALNRSLNREMNANIRGLSPSTYFFICALLFPHPLLHAETRAVGGLDEPMGTYIPENNAMYVIPTSTTFCVGGPVCVCLYGKCSHNDNFMSWCSALFVHKPFVRGWSVAFLPPETVYFPGHNPRALHLLQKGRFYLRFALFCTEVAVVVIFASGVIHKYMHILLLFFYFLLLPLCRCASWDGEFKWRMCVAKLRILIKRMCAPHSISHLANIIVTKMRNIPSTSIWDELRHRDSSSLFAVVSRIQISSPCNGILITFSVCSSSSVLSHFHFCVLNFTTVSLMQF